LVRAKKEYRLRVDADTEVLLHAGDNEIDEALMRRIEGVEILRQIWNDVAEVLLPLPPADEFKALPPTPPEKRPRRKRHR
jgi:hypothetical protein